MLASAFFGFDLMLAASGALTLLVGGVGVGNLMFLRVRRRTREIGIQMALGARPRWILRDVLGESLVLVAAGGLLGFLMAGLTIAIAGATPWTAQIGIPRLSIPLAAGTALLLGAVGLLAGWFPARRASRLDPVRALVD
jgi:putative ABC transport system permease protein